MFSHQNIHSNDCFETFLSNFFEYLPIQILIMSEFTLTSRLIAVVNKTKAISIRCKDS